MATDTPITLVAPNVQGTGGRYRIDGGPRLGGLVDAAVSMDLHGEFLVSIRLGVGDDDAFMVNGLPFIGWVTVPEHRRWMDSQTIRREGTYDYGKLSDSQRRILTDVMIILATVVLTPEHMHAYRVSVAHDRVSRAAEALNGAQAELDKAVDAYLALANAAPAKV